VFRDVITDISKFLQVSGTLISIVCRHHGDQIGRFFANWAIFESPWQIFEQIKEPKKLAIFWAIFGVIFWAIFNHYRVTRLGKILPYGQFFMALGKFFSRKNHPMIWAKF
jgi:hypothetical protein